MSGKETIVHCASARIAFWVALGGSLGCDDSAGAFDDEAKKIAHEVRAAAEATKAEVAEGARRAQGAIRDAGSEPQERVRKMLERVEKDIDAIDRSVADEIRDDRAR